MIIMRGHGASLHRTRGVWQAVCSVRTYTNRSLVLHVSVDQLTERVHMALQIAAQLGMAGIAVTNCHTTSASKH